MRCTVTVCDLCQREVPIKISIKVEGTKLVWDVCYLCYRKPYRKPAANDLAEAEMVMANALKRRAGEVFAGGAGR